MASSLSSIGCSGNNQIVGKDTDSKHRYSAVGSQLASEVLVSQRPTNRRMYAGNEVAATLRQSLWAGRGGKACSCAQPGAAPPNSFFYVLRHFQAGTLSGFAAPTQAAPHYHQKL